MAIQRAVVAVVGHPVKFHGLRRRSIIVLVMGEILIVVVVVMLRALPE